MKFFFIRMAPGMMIVNRYRFESVEGGYPFRATNKGRVQMLLLVLAINSSDINNQCRGSDRDFKIILTTPGETVETTQNYLRLSMLEQYHVDIETQVTITSDGLQNYTSNQRQCFYKSENPLRFFKFYTETNCKTECLANFTRFNCGCVKFSMPSKNC